MKKCSVCGHLSEGERRCPVCRTDVSCLPEWVVSDTPREEENTRRFKHCRCGCENADYALACRQCGAILVNTVVEEEKYECLQLFLRIKDGRSITVPAGGGILGRDHIGSSELRDDRYISRRHARLVPYRGSYRLEMINNVNGAVLNGRVLKGGDRHDLRTGDKLVIGVTEMTVELKDREMAAPRINILGKE